MHALYTHLQVFVFHETWQTKKIIIFIKKSNEYLITSPLPNVTMEKRPRSNERTRIWRACRHAKRKLSPSLLATWRPLPAERCRKQKRGALFARTSCPWRCDVIANSSANKPSSISLRKQRAKSQWGENKLTPFIEDRSLTLKRSTYSSKTRTACCPSTLLDCKEGGRKDWAKHHEEKYHNETMKR